jgi:hypothetical protein
MPIMQTGLRVSFDLLSEQQAQRNHGQSLKRLAERGGLSPCEVLALHEQRSWRGMDADEALRKVKILAGMLKEPGHG